jgi:hypothetical protein
MEAGARLRAAEEAMLAGRADADELRGAAAAERDALDRLMTRAREIAANDGRRLNQATLDRVAETLQAAATDEDVADAVRTGRLAKETKRATIGAGARAPSGRAGRRAKSRAKDGRREREQERAQALRAVQHAEGELERAEAHLDRAQKEVDTREERLKQARAELAQAKRDVKSAEGAVRKARKQAG